MSKDKRRGWLAKLKVGDAVHVGSSPESTRREWVNRITPTGQIRTLNSLGGEKRWRPDGSRAGSEWTLHEATP